MALTQGNVELLPTLTITSALTAEITAPLRFIRQAVTNITLQSNFIYGSSGSTVKVWLQTTYDDGVTWTDIICHAFTTASARKVSSVNKLATGGEAVATDAALSDDSELSGRLGPVIRLKYTTTGTYAGTTTLKVDAVLS